MAPPTSSTLLSLLAPPPLDPHAPASHPTDDALAAHLQARARAEHPCTRLNASDYVVVNPLRALACQSDASRETYEDEVRRTDGGRVGGDAPEASVYEAAGRAWLLASRTGQSQAVVFRGVTGSGKSTAAKHFSSQLLRLAAPSRTHRRLADNVSYALTILESFGSAKSPLNPSTSRHATYTELHLISPTASTSHGNAGTLAGARVMPFGLDKSRLGRLTHDERSFHVFYQLLAGASPDERDALNLEDPSSYALLASSGCYRLPGGPFSDDSAAMGELRAALASLGFKPKHVRSIFATLTAILLLSNLTFTPPGGATGLSSLDQSCAVAERNLLVDIAGHLGLSADELERALINKTAWVRKDLVAVQLGVEGAQRQRDSLMRNLYAILFSFLVEMANKRLQPDADARTTIVATLDLPGYQSRTADLGVGLRGSSPLVEAGGENGVFEFCTNFANELVQGYVNHRVFDDGCPASRELVQDGVDLPRVHVQDNTAVIEMFRGCPLRLDRLLPTPRGLITTLADAAESLKTEEDDSARCSRILADVAPFNRFASLFSTSSSSAKRNFSITHYAGQCAYDPVDFVDAENDVLDKTLVDLLRSSSEAFIAKLVSGPGMATEGHPLNEDIVVQAQVSVAPLRNPIRLGADEDEQVSWPIDTSMPQPVTHQIDAVLATVLTNLDGAKLWTVSCIRPNDSGHPNSFDRRRVRAQLKALNIPELVVRRQVDYVVSYTIAEFCARHGLGGIGPNYVADFASSRTWSSDDYAIGRERVWLGWAAWREQEDLVRSTETRRGSGETGTDDDEVRTPAQVFDTPMGESTDHLLPRNDQYPPTPYGYRDSPRGSADYFGGYADHKDKSVAGEPDPDAPPPMVVHEKKVRATEVIAQSNARKWWLRLVWLLTFWVPSFLLNKVGKMRRPDVRMAWREKLAICEMIAFLCGVVIFYIILFGKLLCPDNDKAWNTTELSEHAGDDDYYAAIAGKVYDFSTFYKGQHSDLSSYTTTSAIMLEFAGQDLTDYFPPPLTVACSGLLTDTSIALTRANFTPIVSYAVHTSGPLQTENGTKLDEISWYSDVLQPALTEYYKGYYVYDKSDIAAEADDQTDKYWGIYNNKVYDLSDYIYTQSYYASSDSNYTFLNSDISDLFEQSTGTDVTDKLNSILEGLSTTDAQQQMACLDNTFYYGEIDFRKTARCTVQNYLLLAFSIIMITAIGSKFIAALQIGSKRHPELLDRFVVCQVPCYTEGEESLKRTIDSLAVLKYDDKRKLIFVICDGNIIGSGNNRPTPRIVLDILGVDEKVDAEPLLFKSIGEGSKQLNYGKVFSGLYEHEGHVVPYLVVVKVGKPSETSKPGNRGKRDSQVMLLQYLNRVHFDAPMCPLELEIYHQMRNVIGIDPTFYEYIFQVDADTTVEPDSLNRLISCTADDSRIIGICGETKLANERESLTTMIQVYEYYISHHLTKAFESLFGSVTCLPGCFSVYRIRTADKGRPVIISSIVIDEYSEPNVDTLHKKNLFSLGEDRYLTTLMMKHFPTYKMKFTADAVAHTVAPNSWKVLLSQRRRWINSTVHNLVELLFLPEMCGFCFFSMRFFVFIDLLGTIILPATFAYIIYLIVVVSTGKAAIPYISLGMIAAVYGLQAIIFILHREFMLIGWMVVYILAMPVYSVLLPIYSFWSMDDFSWGNTRQVVGEGNNKTVVYEDEETFDDSMIPYRTFKEYEANAWETASLHSGSEKPVSNLSARPHAYPPQHSRAPSNYSNSSLLPPGADYYRDSSPLGVAHSSPGLRHASSRQSLASAPGMNPYAPRVPSMAGLSAWGGGSMYDSPLAPPHHNPFDSPGASQLHLAPHGMYPPPPMPGLGAPRNSMMSMAGLGYGMPPPPPPPMGNSRMSSFSLVSGSPYAGPAQGASPLRAQQTGATAIAPDDNPAPSDDDVLRTLRAYLASQDLMTVTKRSAREAMYGLFPAANLQARAGWLNEHIDKILSE